MGGGGGGTTGGGGGPVAGRCAPFPAPTGSIVRVTPSQAAMLPGLVASAASGTTIVLATGVYPVPASGIAFATPGVTLRSESGVPADVTLDGQATTPEVLRVTASDITIAEVTVTRAVDHLIHVSPGGDTGISGLVFYGLRFIDGGEQFLKVNQNGTAYPDNGTVACSSFELTDSGRPRVERTPDGCYTGGIDVHGGRGWVVRNNIFRNIYCAGEGLAEHAVHFWTGARDTLVENNLILNCARGIGFGLGASRAGRTYADDPYPAITNVGHFDGVIRNNFVWANNDWFDTGIGLEQSPGTKVLHNTVVSTAGGSFFTSIDYRFSGTQGVVVRNNLTRRITQRDGATGAVDHNLESTPDTSFVSFGTGDLRLVTGAALAIDQGVADPASGLDIDGLPHDAGLPDLGAHELR